MISAPIGDRETKIQRSSTPRPPQELCARREEATPQNPSVGLKKRGRDHTGKLNASFKRRRTK